MHFHERQRLNFDIRVSVSGTEAAEWDKNTWGPLAELARDRPEAGVHFQGTWP